MPGTAPAASVIFDLDGTLVDSVPVSLSIINAMLAQRGSERRISYAQALPFASSGGLALIEGLLADDCPDPHADLAIFRRHYQATHTPQESLYPGVAEMIASLRGRGARLAICSNKPQHLCEKVLADLDLAQHFNVIVGSSSSVPAKPAPDMLDLTLQKLNATVASSILVGDSEVDEELAASRGMEFLFIAHGYGKCSPTLRPAARFNSIPELAGALLERLPS